MKISNDQIEQQEIDSMADAIGNCLELNNEFVKKYAGETVAALLLQLAEKDREFALQGCIGAGYFPGGLYGELPEAIVLPHGEIEFQFDGDPSEVFETPDDLTINGNLAYLYTGYGLVLPIDCKKLAENISEILTPA
jgi:hypothetical protein